MRRTFGVMLVAAVVSAFAGVAAAETKQGVLELQWGDPQPQAQAVRGRLPMAPQFRVTLVHEEGRTALDPAQALAAAEDLYALGGRRVAVEMSPAPARAASPWRISAIVPADGHTAEVRPQAVLGNTVWRTLMCKFADVTDEQKPLSFFQGQYGTGQGQLDHYWREVSYDKIHLTGSSAHGWFTLPNPRAHYMNGDNPNLNAMADDCIAAADPTVDFSTNGGVQGINMMFNETFGCCAWGGGRHLTLDGVTKTWSTTWNPPWSFNNLSPLAHEMGHGYGLPHANNSDGDSDPYDNPWDVMSGAWLNAANDPTYGSVAKHINTYHRDRLGWIDAARKRELVAGEWLLVHRLDRAGRAGSTDTQVIVVRPPSVTNRWWTIETRRRDGYYEPALAGDAVIIHEVQTGRSTPAQSVDAAVPPANISNNEGSMFKPGETWTAPDGSFRVKVWRADGDAFLVSVCGPAPAPSPISMPKYDRCNLGPLVIGPPTLPR